MKNGHETDELGRRIKAARAYAGMTQQELAGKLGVARITLADWEANGAPRLAGRKEWIVSAIAEATGTTVEFLSGEHPIGREEKAAA